MRIRPVSPLVLLALPLALLAGCSSSKNMTGGTGWVRLHLTDQPGPYEAVNLVVREVSIHRADDASGWEVLSSTTATYDLLQLRNGVFTTMGLALVPAGHYTQIRLKLDPGSNVVVGGVPYPLVVPSGEQSGYKIVGEFDVPAGDSIDVLLDIDADRAVHQTGNGRYMLKPTARVSVINPPEVGAISGQIDPAGTSATIYALMAADTVNTTTAGTGGEFLLPGLPPGGYSVAVHPDPAFRDTTLAGVTVNAGATTSLGVITLTPQ